MGSDSESMAASARVLVIDDQEIARKLMTRLLTSAGFQVFAQPSAIGATRLMIRQQIAVVVIDVHMPALQGDKLVQLFRENPRFSDVGLILVSGTSDGDTLEALGRAAGADAVVPKYAIETSLVREVTRLASRRPRTPTPESPP